MTLAVGIDAGGTKLAVGLVDTGRGTILRRLEVPSDARRGGAAVLSDCLRLTADARASTSIAGVGLGVPELVSPHGRIESAVHWDWRGDDLSSAFAELGPVVVESDVRAAAIGESVHGAGAGFSSFVYVTIGTGVSYALVIAGSPWRGARGNAVILGAPPVETVASGAALRAQTGKTRAEDVLVAPAGEGIVRAAATSLGCALAALVNALDPEAVVIGGGLGLAPAFSRRVVEHMRSEIYADGTRGLPVLPAALGPDAGVVGAALVAVQKGSP